MPSGNMDGHLFRFCDNKRESERRKQRIQELWDRLVDRHGGNVHWNAETLKIAKAISDGESVVEFTADELAPTSLLKVLPFGTSLPSDPFCVSVKEGTANLSHDLRCSCGAG